MNAREETRRRLHEQLCFELGAPVLNALTRPCVTDVHLRPNGALWVKESGQWSADEDTSYEADQRESIVGLVAHSLHREATFATPIIEGEVTINDRRVRFTGLLPPIVPEPEIAIRKPAEVLYSLEDYEQAGIITMEQRVVLRAGVTNRKNILLTGAMGSGKTTFANTIIDLMPGHEHVGTIEDAYELWVRLTNYSPLHTNVTDNIDLQTLVRVALRLQLDRLCIGECRGAEMLAALKAWNLGARGGVATIHANSARAALIRLNSMVLESGAPPQPELIAEAIDLIVFIDIQGDVRRVTEILQMDGLNVDGSFNLIAVA